MADEHKDKTTNIAQLLEIADKGDMGNQPPERYYSITELEQIGLSEGLSYERFYPAGTKLRIDYRDYRTIGKASVQKHHRRWRRSRKSATPISVGCYQPSTTIAIDFSGSCFVCSCPAWVPYPIGNILDFESFEEVWAHPIAKKIQANTEPNASFKFCDTSVCGVEHTEAYEYVYHPDIDVEQILPDGKRIKDIKPLGPCLPGGYITPDNLDRINPYFINIAIDDSCNLQCATCRTQMIHHNNKGLVYEYKKELADHICKLLDRFEHNTLVLIGGDGEIFSSKVYSDIIYNYTPRPNHRFMLKSNGTLITSRIKDSQIMQQLDGFTISIDAGSKEVYERVRCPAKWNTIIKSLDLLRPEGFQRGDNCLFNLNFVLHRENMHDVINFMDLCQHYMTRGTIQAIQNWGTYGTHPVNSPQLNPFLEQRVHFKGDIHYDEWSDIAKLVVKHEHYSNINLENEILREL